MHAKEFVSLWKAEMDSSLRLYQSDEQTLVSSLIAKLDLTKEQEQIFWELAEAMLNDTYYTLLLGIDGCTQIGGNQQTYKIYSEDGSLISECGDIEAEAGEMF